MNNFELKERIAQANAKCDKLNNERQLNLGKTETLTAQFNNGLVEFANKFGKSLTIETLPVELNLELQEKEKELLKVEQIITAIEQGNYVEARRLAGEVVEETPTETLQLGNDITVPSMDSPVAESVTPITTPMVESVQPPVVEQVVAPAVTPPVSPIVPPTIPVVTPPSVDNNVTPPSVDNNVTPPPAQTVVPPAQTVVPPAVPVVTPPTVPVAPNVLGGALDGFQLVNAADSISVAPPTTFQSILGGSGLE